MKRAFTLIELMIVIAVLVTLMAITFRLGNIGRDSEARTITITRMQRLENCLSGFHAAFGCYPPVKLHGNRSFDDQEESINWNNEGEAWPWVERICRTQPIGCRFPFKESMSNYIRELSDLIATAASSGEYEDVFKEQYMKDWATAGFASAGDKSIEGRLSQKKKKILWSEIKLFQFGVMSYLLPRYLVMMGGSKDYYKDGDDGYWQWTKNNQNPSDPFRGDDTTWVSVYEWVEKYRQGVKHPDVTKLRMIPSQSVCARWMPNLEGICCCNTDDPLFGIHIKSSHWSDSGIFDSQEIEYLAPALYGACFSAEGDGSNTDQYVLDGITVKDGWGRELYYYSRQPYQSYTLWSSGPDCKTFPPWLSRDYLRSNDNAGKLAAKWTKDDLIHLSN